MADEEQLEDLKKWWQENGRIVVIGIVVGLGSVGGYSYWQSSTQAKAEHISTRYSGILEAAGENQHAAVLSQADALIAEFPDSGYAGHAALFGARSAYASEDVANARRLLLWATEHASEPFLRQLARLRLARLLIDQDEIDTALAELDKISDSQLLDDVLETRADALRYQGDIVQAGALYTKALENEDLDAQTEIRLKAKLDWVKSRQASKQDS